MRQILLSIEETEFRATMLEKAAPNTCKALWEALPIECHLHHAKIAGNEVFGTFFKSGLQIPEKLENRTMVAETQPGDIFGSETMLGMIYGEVASEPFPVCVFARVTDKKDLEKMKKACRNIWRRNGQKVTVRKLR